MSNELKLRSEVIQFLQENGWSRRVSKDGDIIRYQRADGDLSKPVSIYFDATPNERPRVEAELDGALSTLRQYYGIPFAELRHRIETLSNFQTRSAIYPRDFVTTRVPDRYVQDDTVDLSIAYSTIGYLRSLVEGAAIAEAEHMGAVGRAGVRSAKDYSETCRFGHTFRGSFGFQVECPLSEASQLSLDLFDTELPLGRKVSERIAAGMSSLCDAFEKNDISLLTTRQDGFSARMCDDLADFLERSELSSILFGVELDSALPSSLSDAPKTFDIRVATVPLLREATKHLEPEPDERPVNVVGRVVVLKASGKPLVEDDAGKRLVTIHWESDEGKRNVQIELNPRDYAEAIKAHEGGLHVQVRGNLLKRGNRYTLSDLTSFIVLV